MRSPIRPIAAAGTALIAIALTGCHAPWSTPTAAEPSVQPDEVATHGDHVCPKQLPLGKDPNGHGFGTEAAATERPNLLTPDQAWTCQYYPVDRITVDSVIYSWQRNGDVRPVDDATLPVLEDALDDLEPYDGQRACTSDLGPRWMVVYSHGGDLTGVLIDDYGCRDVRLTEEPFTTAPGDHGQEGVVGGVLDGGAGLLSTLGVGRSR